MKKFLGFAHPYSSLDYFQSKRRLIQIKLCRNASIKMNLSKNNSFSREEAINYIARTKKRKKVPV